MRGPGRPPKAPRLYEYVVIHGNAPSVFERQLNAMASQGWRVIGQSFSSVQFFSALMEKERHGAEAEGTGSSERA